MIEDFPDDSPITEDVQTAWSCPVDLTPEMDDLKACYTEAVTAQPGGASPGSQALLDWFWEETVASKALFAIKNICMKSSDEVLQLVGKMLIVPMAKARMNPWGLRFLSEYSFN